MDFKSINDANEHFRNYRDVDKLPPTSYWDDYKHKCSMGDWMIIQHIRNDKKQVSRPLLIMTVGHTIWDQALVLEFIEPWRAFHYNNTVDEQFIFGLGYDVQHIQFWTDDIIVLGHWKQRPTFNQLRTTLNKLR